MLWIEIVSTSLKSRRKLFPPYYVLSSLIIQTRGSSCPTVSLMPGSSDATLICVVCGGPSKYRCPRCRDRYCSVSCCREHRALCEPTTQTETENPVSKTEPPTESSSDTSGLLSGSQRERLEQSSWVREVLRSKRLTAAIDGILDAEDRSAELKRCRQNPEFESFVLGLLSELNGWRDQTKDFACMLSGWSIIIEELLFTRGAALISLNIGNFHHIQKTVLKAISTHYNLGSWTTLIVVLLGPMEWLLNLNVFITKLKNKYFKPFQRINLKEYWE